MKDLLVSIDQGGSKTDVVIFASSGELLLRYDDKRLRETIDAPFEEIRWTLIEKVVLASLQALGASIIEVEHIIAALCGADWPEDYTRMRELLASHLKISSHRITIVNDSMAALRAGQPFREGRMNSAVIYAGTMFNCSLISSSGSSYTYGQLVNGEDHGAFAIGRQVWGAILDSYNGLLQPTLMTNLLLQRVKADSVLEICQMFNENSLAFSPVSYASILFQAVKCGDMVARNIFCKFARRWTDYFGKGAQMVGYTDESEVALYLSGGIFKNCPDLWLNEIKRNLSQYRYKVDCSIAKHEPVMGAVLLLLEMLNKIPLDEHIIGKITRSIPYKSLMIDSSI